MASFLLIGVVCARGETRMENSPSTTARPDIERNQKVDGDVREFVEKAAKCGMKEVAISRSALPNLSNPQVRAFAEKIIAQHSKANAELTALAQAKGVSLPAPDQGIARKWADNNKNTDENYIEAMVSDHKEAVDLFEDALDSEDAEIAAFASRTLPDLRQHLTVAQNLEKQVD